MSFISDIVDTASSFLSSDGIGASLAKTALAGYALNQITNSITPEDANAGNNAATSTTKVDPGVRQQVDASTDNAIPVVYGSAVLGGKVFDAVMEPSGDVMWFALAICEKTGGIASRGGFPSKIKFNAVYWNNSLVVWDYDGFSVKQFYDPDSGNTTDDPDQLVQIYLYNNGSRGPMLVDSIYGPGYGSQGGDGGHAYAYDLMPGWTNQHTADNLVFALVKVTYNKDKNYEIKIVNSKKEYKLKDIKEEIN
jgi:hypothetical protein